MPKEEQFPTPMFDKDGKPDRDLSNRVKSQDILNSVKPFTQEELERQQDVRDRKKERSDNHAP